MTLKSHLSVLFCILSSLFGWTMMLRKTLDATVLTSTELCQPQPLSHCVEQGLSPHQQSDALIVK